MGNKAGFEEKRQFPRLSSHIPVRYQVRGEADFNDTLSDDISIGGICVNNKEFVAPQTILNLKLNVLSRVLSTQGTVAWSAPLPHSDKYRMGIQFSGFELSEKNYFGDYINMQLGNL
ncbi:MAG: PilZ domain-containing protein [Candidatus Omnitrophota bacterium]